MEIIVVKDLFSVDWVMPEYYIDSNGEITSGRKRLFDSLSQNICLDERDIKSEQVPNLDIDDEEDEEYDSSSVSSFQSSSFPS